MKRFRHCLFAMIGASLSSSIISLAQTFQPLSPYGNITPSVETYTMSRYGSLVPSLYTGAMEYSLPLYTYTDPDFTIPISLDYHYDGYRPSQHSGTVGLGWSLRAGGVITREIRGIPDEGTIDNSIKGWKAARAAGIIYEPANNICSSAMVGCLVNINGFPYLDECKRNAVMFDAYHDTPMFAVSGQQLYYDTAPDLFHFDFCGYRGDFMILDDGSIRAYNSNVPYGEMNISFLTGTDTMDPEFVITMADGTEYRFGGSWENLESAHSRPCGQETLNVVFGLGFSASLGSSANDITSTTITGFHLYQIKAPNGRIVSFNREPGRLWDVFMSSDFINKGNVRPEYKETIISNTCTSPLDSITVDGKAIITFSFENKMHDEDSVQYFLSDEIRDDSVFLGLNFRGLDFRIRPAKRLSGITVRNHSRDLVDQIVLTHSYASAGTPRMFLSSVSSLRTGIHSFEYDLVDFELPEPDHLGYDHWGFWNGKQSSDVKDHLNYTLDGDPVADLYCQMRDAQKNADASYSVCGSLKRIIYPTGGETEITYEGNTVGSRVQADHSFLPCTPYTVGGIRVKQMVDRDGSGQADTTRFLYASNLGTGSTSGVLMQMPRHALATQFSYEAEYQDAGMPNGYTDVYFTYVHSITYSNKGYFNASRDNHIAYRYVTIVHPDASKTSYEFNMDEDFSNGGLSMGKNVFARDIGTTFSLMSTENLGPLVTNDKKNLRGQPVWVREYDAEDRQVHSTYNYYDSDVVTIASMLFNEPEHYTKSPFSVSSPRLLRTETTSYFYDASGVLTGSITLRNKTDYNSMGQTRSKRTETSCDTLHTYFRYIHESGATSPSGFNRLVSEAIKTRDVGGKEYLISAEHYDYGMVGNPHPTRITSYNLGDGIDVSGYSFGSMFSTAVAYPNVQFTYEYDNKYRLTKASSPGGAWISYAWEGNHIVSRTENGNPNQSLYSWIDLIGLTGKMDPSGREESYEYDSRNRPWKVLDTDGRTVSVTHYHLQNDR